MTKHAIDLTYSRLFSQDADWNIGATENLLIDAGLLEEKDVRLDERLLAEVQEVAEAIGVPWKKWPGRCMEIASLCVKHGVVKGRAVYGIYRGDIHARSQFSGRPMTHHGWVELEEEGEIFDPTNWCFGPSVKPYLFIGPRTDEYDISGSKFRSEIRNLRPMPEPSDKRIALSISKGALVDDICTKVPDAKKKKDGVDISISQLIWYCNDPNIPDVCQLHDVLKKKSLAAFLPIDVVREAEHQRAKKAGK